MSISKLRLLSAKLGFSSILDLIHTIDNKSNADGYFIQDDKKKFLHVECKKWIMLQWAPWATECKKGEVEIQHDNQLVYLLYCSI